MTEEQKRNEQKKKGLLLRLNDDKFHALRKRVREYASSLGERAGETFYKCFFNTIDTTCHYLEDGSVFVVTGDIPAMWLRDSAAQVMQYLHFSDDEDVRGLIKGVIKKQVDFIITDTYANAFMKDAYQVSSWDGKYLTDRWGKLIWERKFELDSLCYPMFLACKYYEKTQDDSIFTAEFLWAFEQIKTTVEIERKHSERSTYFCRYWCKSEVVGKDQDPASEKGLVWSGYRPSDDKCKYHYHIPDNIFLVSVLYKLTSIFKKIGQNQYAEYCEEMVSELKPLIEQYGVVEDKELGKVYVSETDCMGNYHIDDDANIPSLLSLPYLEYPFLDKEIYANTRKLILSKRNKYYYEGACLKGIGSPHTPENRVWHLAVAMQGLTSEDEEEIEGCYQMLIDTTDGEGYMHEGVDCDDPSHYSRPWFAWANSMFANFVLEKPKIISQRN